MTDVLSQLPEFPMPRDPKCPFDPPPDLKQLRAEAPVTRVRLEDGLTAWLITRYEDQREILSDPRITAETTHPNYPHASIGIKPVQQASRTIFTMDNPDHDNYRRMLTKDFMAKRVQALRPRIQEIVDGFIDDLLARTPPVDFLETFALQIPSLVICEILGVPYADHGFFQERARVFFSRTATREENIKAAKDLGDFIAKLADEKDREPTDDLISRLVVNQMRKGTMTRDEVVDTARTLLVGGHETTASMIALSTLAWLRHPEQLDEIRESDDPQLIANAVEEMLRYLHVTHNGRRRVALEDIEIGGQLIKAGEGIIAANDAGNRDETVFPDPDVLDIHRNARHHIAFGYGIHQCLGQQLARVELQVIYSTLFRRIPTLRLAIPFEKVPFKNTMIVYGVHELPVTW